VLASRAPGGAGDPLEEFDQPLHTSRLPSVLLTRAWDHGLFRAPAGFDVVHSVSLASPQLRRSSPERFGRDGARPGVAPAPRSDDAARCTLARGGAAPGQPVGGRARVPSRLVEADVLALGVAGSRVTVVPGGADHLPAPDPGATDALLRRVGVSGDFLLTVSTLEPRKNVERLVLAFGQVRDSLPGPWPLVIVGPTGWGPEPAGSPPADHVVFTGPVPGVVLSELYRRARAFAYVPLTEAMACPHSRPCTPASRQWCPTSTERARPRCAGPGTGAHRRPARHR